MPLLNDVYRKKVYDYLADAMLASMEKGEFPVEEAEDSAVFVSDRLNTIQSDEELTIFLDELTTRWPVYKTAYTKIKEDQRQVDDNAKIAEIQSKITNYLTP